VNRTQAWGLGWAGGRGGVAIRQAGPEDLPALGDFFAGLSAHTRYLRFFGPVTPGTTLLRTLCGAADNIDALVAIRGGVIVGHAMAVDRIEPHNPKGPRGTRVTDIGVVVEDAWQGRGVGAALMRALVTGAQARGVTTLEMDVLDGNRQVLAMVTAHWPAARIEHNSDGFAIRVRLPQASSKPAAIAPHLAIG
jgi:GNAT superfamily N-acetyltransferase